MQLYNLPLNPSTAILKAVCGSFTAPKTQQIILAKSKTIELYSISENGKLELVVIEDLFCILRTIVAFRYQGTLKDLLVLGSDSGKVIILEFNQHRKRFVKIHQQVFGKTGCRRVVPGQYIAVDPRGRALMIAAVQKQKFVYVLQRNEQKLMIHSPREAHKSHALCIDVVALDTGSDNAVFACIEIDYGEVQDKQALVNTGAIKKSIVYYEMDFGMNTVIRKKEVPVDPTAHMLIAVPAGSDGPGGLLAVLEDYLLYRNNNQEQMIRFPLRVDRPVNRKTQFTVHSSYKFKGFFFLICSELGDLFKIEFLTKDGQTKDHKQIISIKIEYFYTVSCLTSMCLSKNGFLFCASEREDHCLYNFGANDLPANEAIYTHSQMAHNNLVQFQPRTNCPNILQITDTIEQYGPTTDLKVADLKQQGNPQIYTTSASGTGKSYLRIIKQGLRVKQLRAIKYHMPQDIWCLKSSQSDEHDRMIVMSLANKTLMLTMTPNGYSQTRDTGIEEESFSIHIGRLQDDSMIQILPNGFRHIRKDKTVRTMKFEGRIIKGITKSRQMVLALAGGDIVYYQLDQTGAMSQVTQTTLDSEVVAFDFSPIEKGRIRSSFLAVALSDFTTRIFELNTQSCLKVLSTQNMKSAIQSIAIEEMDTNEDDNQRYGMQLYLYAGLQNGMLIRTSIDTITGKLTDSRPKYLGLKPVKCIKLQVLNKPAILALSSRPWLIYTYGKKQMTTLLAFPYISVASQIKMPSYSHTIIVFSQNYLRIICLQNFGNIFHSEKIPLDFSAKKLLVFDRNLAIIESEQVNTLKKDNVQTAKRKWNSQVTIFNPKENRKIGKIDVRQNEICLSMCYCTVTDNNETHNYLAIGCVRNMVYYPAIHIEEPSIKVYQWDSSKMELTFLHATQLQDAPIVLHCWKQKILAGVGKCLRAYQIGRKRLLRKAQIKNLNSPVNTIKTWGQRIYATELNDSFHMYKYKAREQTFYDIADDVLTRYITTTAILDYHTMIGADKFENIFISRVPHNAEEDFENNPNSYKFRWENGYLNGAPFKMEQICSFYVGEVVTAIERASLATSGSEIIIYSTINGGICALSPFETREQVDFFTHLELYLRNLTPMLGGRDQLSYRSYYSPCKAVVDGDLCEVFNRLTYEQQVQVGKHLDRNPQQIQKKLQEMRNRLI